MVVAVAGVVAEVAATIGVAAVTGWQQEHWQTSSLHSIHTGFLLFFYSWEKLMFLTDIQGFQYAQK